MRATFVFWEWNGSCLLSCPQLDLNAQEPLHSGAPDGILLGFRLRRASKGWLRRGPCSGSGPCRTAGAQAWHPHRPRATAVPLGSSVVVLTVPAGAGLPFRPRVGSQSAGGHSWAPRVLSSGAKTLTCWSACGWGAGNRGWQAGACGWGTPVAQRWRLSH